VRDHYKYATTFPLDELLISNGAFFPPWRAIVFLVNTVARIRFPHGGRGRFFCKTALVPPPLGQDLGAFFFYEELLCPILLFEMPLVFPLLFGRSLFASSEQRPFFGPKTFFTPLRLRRSLSELEKPFPQAFLLHDPLLPQWIL